MEFFTPRMVMALSSVLFCIGAYGVLGRKNLLVMLMSLELMLVAVNIVLVLFSRIHYGAAVDPVQDPELFRSAHAGQFFTLMVMTVAAGEVGVGLAIVVLLYRMKGAIDVDQARELRL